MKVQRRVDTVIVEMDIQVAEQLVELLDLVQDNTRKSHSYQGSDIRDLQQRLTEAAEVRSPSPLYLADVKHGYVLLADRI